MRARRRRRRTSEPPYVFVAGPTGIAFGSLAICEMDTHLPWPEQSYVPEPGHAAGAASRQHPQCRRAPARATPRGRQHLQRWHASPTKPGKHLHWPVARSHSPALLHSASACAVFEDVGMSTQARSAGHVRMEQSAAR